MNRSHSQIPIMIAGLILLIAGCTTQNYSVKPADSPPMTKSTKLKPPPPAATPAPLIQTGRYSATAATPTEAQSNPLRVMITVTIPREISTVREAIQYLLRRSGYRLTEPKPQAAPIAYLFSLPLPQVHRRLGPMPLESALSALAGPAFELQADPLQRTVGYELAEVYREPEFRVEVAHE